MSRTRSGSDPDLAAPFATLHATTVAVQARALMILGPSGAGKSALALQLLAMGAQLVADDQTRLSVFQDQIWAEAPPGLPPLIEARGLGLLNAGPLVRAPLALVVDLGQMETQRLPPLRHFPLPSPLSGPPLPLVFRSDQPHFPSGLFLALKHGLAV